MAAPTRIETAPTRPDRRGGAIDGERTAARPTAGHLPARRWRPAVGSLRFRVAALSSLLLAAVLLGLGLALPSLLARSLREDVDGRLTATARQVAKEVQSKLDDGRSEKQTGTLDGGDLPDLNAFASSGIGIKVLDTAGTVVGSSNSAYSPPFDEDWLPDTSVSGRSGTTEHTASVDDEDIRAVRVPIYVVDKDTDGKRLYGSVVVGESLASIQRSVGLLRRILLGAAAVGLTLTVAGGWLLAGRALRPVDRVTSAAAAIAASDGSPAALANRLAVPATGDEIARLAATFNAMLERLEGSFMAQRRFVADASHELRTPLTALRGNIELLLDRVASGDLRLGSDDLAGALDDMEREGARMGRLLDDLLLLARADAPAALVPRRPGPVRLDLVAQDALPTARALARGQALTVDADTPVLVAGDADQLLQLVLILVDNALRYTAAGGDVVVSVGSDGAGKVRLEVRDTGEGIAPEALPHLFERFWRADRARTRATGGAGLGLAIADEIVRAHGGTIEVTSTLGVGSTFGVTLPAISSPDAISAAADADPARADP